MFKEYCDIENLNFMFGNIKYLNIAFYIENNMSVSSQPFGVVKKTSCWVQKIGGSSLMGNNNIKITNLPFTKKTSPKLFEISKGFTFFFMCTKL